MLASKPTVSVVIPCYNEVGQLRELHTRIRAEFTELDHLLRKSSLSMMAVPMVRLRLLRELAAVDPDCRVIVFRKNSGKAAALEIGFRAARGEVILTMDADLQDDPQGDPRFLDELTRADLVSGWKATRHDPLGKTLPSKLFNATVRHVTGVQLHDMNCGFKGYRRQWSQEMSRLWRDAPLFAGAGRRRAAFASPNSPSPTIRDAAACRNMAGNALFAASST